MLTPNWGFQWQNTETKSFNWLVIFKHRTHGKGKTRQLSYSCVLYLFVNEIFSANLSCFNDVTSYCVVLQGVTRDKARWNKCVDFLNVRLGPATGAMFVHEKFRKESKVVVSRRSVLNFFVTIVLPWKSFIFMSLGKPWHMSNETLL